MGTKMRAGLGGPLARLGEVPAADVARLILDLERAIRRAAQTVLGRPEAAGRPGRVVEQAADWRLLAISEGSVVVELGLPDADAGPDALDIDARTLADEALLKTLRVVAEEDEAPELAAAMAELADHLEIGQRYDQVWFEIEDPRRRRVTIDAAVRERLRLAASRPSRDSQRDKVSGTLYEADFEKNSAHLRAPDGSSVRVSFDDALADDIQTALRSPAELEGEVRYDPRTSIAKAVELRAVRRADQLMIGLDASEFWRNPSIEELREARGVGPVSDVSSLRLTEASDEELEAFLAALSE